MPDVKCTKCGKSFHAKPSWIKYGHAKFCSRICQYAARKIGKIVRCAICLKKVYKSPKDFRKSKSKLLFCSRTCQTIWRNQVFRGKAHGNWKGGKHVEYRQMLIKHR